MLRRVASILVGLQALVIAVSVVLIMGGVFGAGSDAEVGVAVSIVGLLLAGALGFTCQALWLGRTWPRGLIITWQVLLSVVMVSNLLTEWSLISLGALVVAVVCATAIIVDLRQEKSPTAS